MTSATQLIEAVEQVDPGAAQFLLETALFETLADFVEADRPAMEADMRAEIVAKNAGIRRQLVRKFIDARLHQDEVEPYLAAAAHLTMIDGEIAKARDWWKTERRDHGKWAKGNRSRSTLDVLQALAQDQSQDPQFKGSGMKWVNADRYDRSRQVGEALHSAGLHTAGNAAGVIGHIGPEAEDVLGPHLRRTAYRYRGTERRPDAALVDNMRFASAAMVAMHSKDPSKKIEGEKTLQREDAPTPNVPGQAPRGIGSTRNALVRFNQGNKFVSRDQRELDLQADVATNYLIGKVPTMNNAQLSMHAGKTPPSQGVLIDSDGDVVSQAVGFNGDHYVPFDLKNLKRLNGGQYVRTRVQGGPTTEDIYTGLMTGARQMTVVSNTGVFKMEFDPDLRGGRRYNDKARQMVSRYQAILGAIAGDKATIGDIPLEERQKLRQKALEDTNNHPKEAGERYKVLLEEAQQRALFLHEDADIDDAAHQQALREADETARRGIPGHGSVQDIARRTAELKPQLRQQAADSRYRTLKLDGPGYLQAMESLKEEFPFFIRRVDFTPLEKFQNDRGLVDRKTNLVRSSIKGKDSGFVGAHQVAYGQTGRYKAKGAAAEKIAEEAAAKENAGTSGGRSTSTRTAVKSQPWSSAHFIQETRKNKDEGFDALRNHVRNGVIDPGTDAQRVTSLSDTNGNPERLAAWIFKSGTADSFEKEFIALGDDQQEAVISGLRSLKSAAAYKDGDDNDAMQEAGDKLAGYLRLRKPFANADKGDVTKIDDLPLKYDDIYRLGPSNKAHARFLDDNKETGFLAQVNAYDADPAAAKTDINKLIGDYEDAKINSDPTADLEKQIRVKQRAFAFVHGRKLAAEHGLQEEDPKASASSGEAAPFLKSLSPEQWSKFQRAMSILRS